MTRDIGWTELSQHRRRNKLMQRILLSAVFALALTIISVKANAEVINIGISTVGLVGVSP